MDQEELSESNGKRKIMGTYLLRSKSTVKHVLLTLRMAL